MKLDHKDVIKLIGFLGVCLSTWYDLKTDLAVIKAKVGFIEERVDRLENQSDKRFVAHFPKLALVPAETKIEDE